MMERISKWRATQLTPWRQQQQHSPATHPATAQADNTSTTNTAAPVPPAAVGGQQAVQCIYGAYSSIKLGSSVLALHRDGYLQLLRDAGMLAEAGGRCVPGQAVWQLCYIPSPMGCMACASLGCVSTPSAHSVSLAAVSATVASQCSVLVEERTALSGVVCGRSELSVADAVDVFDKMLASSSPPAKPAVRPAPPSSTAPADGTNSCNGNSSSSRPTDLSHGLRQSTFMRCVTQQLLQRLEAGAQGAAAALEAGAEDSSAGTPADPTATTVASSPSASAVVNSAQTAPPGAVAGTEGSMMTSAQFLQAIMQLSRHCFPRIANGARAWKLLLERHIQPLADRKRGR